MGFWDKFRRGDAKKMGAMVSDAREAETAAQALLAAAEEERADAMAQAIGRMSEMRGDGWASALTSLGNAVDDKGASVTFRSRAALARDTLQAMYVQDWLMGRGVDEIAEECFREGYEVLVADDPEMAHALQEALDATGYQTKLLEAFIWARTFGGGLVWMVVDDVSDDKNLILPMKESHNGILELRVYDRWWAWPIAQPYDNPPAYRIQDIFLQRVVEVDASRVLRFDGEVIPNEQRLGNLGWGGSSMERPYDAVRNFQASHAAATTVMQEYIIDCLKMEGLHAALMSPNGSGIVGVRARAFKRGKSVANMALIDKEEEFTRIAARVSGMAEILDRQRDAAAGALSTPSARLFGTQQGIRAGAQEDEQVYDRRVAAKQRDKIIPLLKRLLEVVMLGRDSPTKGKIVPFDIKARPLRVLTKKEKAEVYFTTAQADEKYFDMGVLQPNEVRTSRFAGQHFSTETTLEENVSAAMKAASVLEPIATPEVVKPKSTVGAPPEAPDDKPTEP